MYTLNTFTSTTFVLSSNAVSVHPYAVILAARPPSCLFFFDTFLLMVVKSLALYVFLKNVTFMLWFIFSLCVVRCCISPFIYAWRDGGNDAKEIMRTFLVLDFLVVGVFTVWESYV